MAKSLRGGRLRIPARHDVVALVESGVAILGVLPSGTSDHVSHTHQSLSVSSSIAAGSSRRKQCSGGAGDLAAVGGGDVAAVAAAAA